MADSVLHDGDPRALIIDVGEDEADSRIERIRAALAADLETRNTSVYFACQQFSEAHSFVGARAGRQKR
jgi:hypothetical protein